MVDVLVTYCSVGFFVPNDGRQSTNVVACWGSTADGAYKWLRPLSTVPRWHKIAFPIRSQGRVAIIPACANGSAKEPLFGWIWFFPDIWDTLKGYTYFYSEYNMWSRAPRLLLCRSMPHCSKGASNSRVWSIHSLRLVVMSPTYCAIFSSRGHNQRIQDLPDTHRSLLPSRFL